MLKDLLRTRDLCRSDLKYLLRRARKFKQNPHSRRSLLAGDSVCLYFAKPSTRSRISSETAVARLGGAPIILSPNDLQMGRGESVEDTARVISRYSRALLIRAYQDDQVERFARAATIPVINLLTDGHHPCQSVADLLTIQQHRGTLKRCRIAYLGAGNNVCVSLMEAAVLAGADIRIASPKEYSVPAPDLELSRVAAQQSGSEVLVTEDPEEACRGAHVLYTDVWLSMGDAPDENESRRRAFLPYQVTKRLLDLGGPDVLFLHCLPAHRGEEVTEEVLESSRSVVFDQAENRLPTAMAILYALLEQKLSGRGSATEAVSR